MNKQTKKESLGLGFNISSCQSVVRAGMGTEGGGSCEVEGGSGHSLCF